MEHNIDLSGYSIRTDLALEAHELAQQQNESNIPGVWLQADDSEANIKVTRLHVQNEEAGKQIGKLPGHYLTMEIPKLRDNDTSIEEQVAKRFAVEFAGFLKQLGISEDKKALVVGLGNWNVTPDALGPMVVENLLVTRHLYQLAPETVGEGYRGSGEKQARLCGLHRRLGIPSPAQGQHHHSDIGYRDSSGIRGRQQTQSD
jgi:spore protease